MADHLTHIFLTSSQAASKVANKAVWIAPKNTLPFAELIAEGAHHFTLLYGVFYGAEE